MQWQKMERNKSSVRATYGAGLYVKLPRFPLAQLPLLCWLTDVNYLKVTRDCHSIPLSHSGTCRVLLSEL